MLNQILNPFSTRTRFLSYSFCFLVGDFIQIQTLKAAVVQSIMRALGSEGSVSKRKGSNPVHHPSVGWDSSLGATVS
ncbi:hypothetical protein E2C01_100365 [Portunus trituberculatus]|uniref:Uncharacterized protein n=1 Tax=Portunus trituberculatus TaxID=210409 RepID=A0A5B7KDE6_PORTR|nr:hypothetical protein [Portunus trituberculatus]